MKKLSLFVIIGMLLVLSSCGNSTKYCNVPGCPSEAWGKTNYCSGHGCVNTGCDNPNINGMFCEECIKRAVK